MDFTCGCARKVLSAAEPQTLRDQLDQDELLQVDGTGQGITGTGAVIIDNRRRRPLYFDGRFLAARDLTREQNYFLTRQADLGRAGGSGVVHGLQVSPGSSFTSLRISAGHGITPSGELVLLDSNVEIDLADIADIQRLDAAFGLVKIPNPPAGTRSGLFVLALRPVEFTANPIASYPTSITGPRSVEDGDIVEAAAITLIPYPQEGARNEINQRRSSAAREIFVMDDAVTGRARGMPTDALPLAMIALDRGFVEWIDPYLVRREVGAEHGDVLGLGFSPRATREAYLLQYDHNLQDVLRQRLSARKGWKFSASEHFQSLPPAGRMPAASINPADFTQVFFPPEVEVELSFIPDDELRALLEESLLLPPIDLTLSGDDLESTSVVVMLPVPRHTVRELKSRLTALRRTLLPAAPNLVARRRPIEVLKTLRFPPVPAIIPPPDDLGEAAWRKALAAADLLWFMRRRNLSYKSEITGLPVNVIRDELASEKTLEAHLRAMGVYTRYTALRAAASSNSVSLISGLLSSPKLLASDVLTEAALNQFEKATALDSASVLSIATPLMDPKFGTGIARAESANPALKDRATVAALLDAGALNTIDQLGNAVDETVRLKTVTDEVTSLVKSSDPQKDTRLKAVDSATTLLVSRKALASPVVTEAALASLENATKVDAATAETTATKFIDPAFGSGLNRLERADPGIKEAQVVKDLAASGVLADLDRLGSAVTDETQLKTLSGQVLDLARGSDPDKAAKIRSLVSSSLKEIPR